jgi:ssDNA-binding Zn-finger/Zn-ribbon topoisomerase 1
MTERTQDESGRVIASGSRIDCFCPHCSQSLVAGEHLRLRVQNARGEHGELSLSPYLNVFESSSTLEAADGEEAADVACPNCERTLRHEKRLCEVCGSGAAMFRVSVANHSTDFFICLRKSCHWHGISEADRSRLILEAEGFHQPDGDRQLIQSGTRLRCACPHCRELLGDGTDMVVEVKDQAGHEGTLTLSPYLNVFNTRCTLVMQPREELGEMACPRCKHTLLESDARCALCGAGAARFLVQTSRGDVSFFICARRQCHWHGLDDEARRNLQLEPGEGSWRPPSASGL